MTGRRSEASFPDRATWCWNVVPEYEAGTITSLPSEDEAPPDFAGRRTSKKYLCPDCLSVFSSPYHLNRHRRSHTGERPYKCNECDCAFKQVPHLKAHRLVHVKERPYKCQQCEFSFKRADTLKVHLRTHTGQKPFRCKTCGFAYSRNANLKTHKCFRTRKAV